MQTTVSNDRVTLDMDDREVARLRAAVRARLGKANPTKADMERALSGAFRIFFGREVAATARRGGRAKRSIA